MAALAEYQPTCLTHNQLDIADNASVQEVLGRLAPQVVINTAAYNRVDDCESYPDRGFFANAIGPHNLAQACAALDAVLVHFSTDYVFDGDLDRPYTEADVPVPISAYGVSKLAGEHLVRYGVERHIIIRTCGLYGKAGSRSKGGNFVQSMLKLAREGKTIKVVDDQTLTPTYTLDLAQKVKQVILSGGHGLYHVTNQGACTWYEFARQVFAITGIDADLYPTTSAEYGAKARRPRNSVLANRRLHDLRLGCLRPWTEALAAYLGE